MSLRCYVAGKVVPWDEMWLSTYAFEMYEITNSRNGDT